MPSGLSHLMALKVAPALVAGNTVIVKSAEEAPLAVLRICELVNRVLPPGCFNMLSGYGPECGAPLIEHPKVRKVTFTGSVEVGRIVARAAAEKLIPVTLELGGKSPMIVFADCDFEKTVAGAITIEEGMRTPGATGRACSRLPDDPGLRKGLFLRRPAAKSSPAQHRGSASSLSVAPSARRRRASAACCGVSFDGRPIAGRAFALLQPSAVRACG